MVTSAHEGLSKVYGTSDALNKLALGGGYVGSLFGAIAGKSAWEDQEENRREGERVTNEIRAALARRNAPILDGFRTGSFTTTRSYDFDAQPGLGGSSFPYREMYPERMLPMPGEMVHLASAIGSDLAEYSVNKEAGIGTAIGSLAGGIGKGLGAIGKGVLKMPTVKGMGSIGQGALQGAKNMVGSIGGALKSTVENTAQKAQGAWGGFKQNMQQRALTRQYGMQRAGQRLETGLTRAGQKVESALGGTPTPFKGPTVTIDPAARRAAAKTRLQGMQQKGIKPGGGGAGQLQTPGTPAATPNPAGPTPAQAPKTTNPAPTNQTVQAEPQGQGAPYRAQPAQQPAPPPPQQHATAQQPAPAPQPAQPPATGPAAQGGAPQPAAAPPPPPPPTPPMGQGQPAQPPPPTPQPTASQPTTATAQAGQEGPAASPQQQIQKAPGGFDLQKAWDRTGLSNERWKWKLPALAAGAATAYGLYRAGKAGFNWLGQESHPEQWGNPYLQPAASVNEWGVPQR